MTTTPVDTVAPAGGTAVVGVAHEGSPLPVGDAGVPAAGDDAPDAPLVDPPVHGWVRGGVVGIGATGVGAEGGVVVVGGKAPPVGGVVLAGVGDGVAAGAGAGVGATVGGGVVVGVVGDVVVAGDGAGAGGGAAVVVATGAGAADVAPMAAPVSARAAAARHRLASSTAAALTVTASRRLPARAGIPSALERRRWGAMRYLSLTVRVTVWRCPAPSLAANRRTSVTTFMPVSRRVGRRRLITLCGWAICDSVS